MIVYDPSRTTPNWAPGSWEYLEKILPEDAICFEWGGGQSTKWLLDRVPEGFVFTVDHDVEWIDRINTLTDFDERLSIMRADKDSPAYVAALTRINRRPNVYLIDGYQRPECLALMLETAFSDDIIVCDDALDYCDHLPSLEQITRFWMPHPCKGTPYNKNFHRQGMHPDTKETWIWRV